VILRAWPRPKMSRAHQKFNLIDIPDISPAGQRFVELNRYRDSPWIRLSGLPANALERRLMRPRLARWRGAWQAVRVAKRVANPVIVSHMPRMTAAVSRLASMFGVVAPHIAFSFTFTDLPEGADLRRLRADIARVDRLVVFSDYEARVYAEYFDLPRDRFRSVRWTQDPHEVKEATVARPFEGPYLCAIGGEGRDYRTLVDAARATSLPLVLIGRPHNLVDLRLPDNVRGFANLPWDVTWEIAANSVGVVVPLLDLATRCGLVTVTTAALLGLPVVTSRAHVLAEYLDGHVAGPVFSPGNVDECALALRDLFSDAARYRAQARGYVEDNRAFFDRALWGQQLDSILDEFA